MTVAQRPDVTGIVLAAGAGSRAGTPKALLRHPSGEPWLQISARVLRAGGCSRVVVVLGARAQEARLLAPSDAEVVVAERWQLGMSESLRAGLAAASGDAALVTLVDLPTLPASVVRRVLAGAGGLRRAVVHGEPAHPVYFSADHWMPAASSLEADTGARRYLAAHDATAIECGDLWDGVDYDLGN
ncbi:MAG: nucleotidyltransferase family protein [Rhodoglobus sp.]